MISWKRHSNTQAEVRERKMKTNDQEGWEGSSAVKGKWKIMKRKRGFDLHIDGKKNIDGKKKSSKLMKVKIK